MQKNISLRLTNEQVGFWYYPIKIRVLGHFKKLLFHVIAYRYLLELGMLVFLTELELLGLKGKWYK